MFKEPVVQALEKQSDQLCDGIDGRAAGRLAERTAIFAKTPFEAGAKAAASIAEPVGDADVIALMLPDPTDGCPAASVELLTQTQDEICNAS